MSKYLVTLFNKPLLPATLSGDSKERRQAVEIDLAHLTNRRQQLPKVNITPLNAWHEKIEQSTRYQS